MTSKYTNKNGVKLLAVSFALMMAIVGFVTIVSSDGTDADTAVPPESKFTKNVGTAIVLSGPVENNTYVFNGYVAYVDTLDEFGDKGLFKGVEGFAYLTFEIPVTGNITITQKNTALGQAYPEAFPDNTKTEDYAIKEGDTYSFLIPKDGSKIVTIDFTKDGKTTKCIFDFTNVKYVKAVTTVPQPLTEDVLLISMMEIKEKTTIDLGNHVVARSGSIFDVYADFELKADKNGGAFSGATIVWTNNGYTPNLTIDGGTYIGGSWYYYSDSSETWSPNPVINCYAQSKNVSIKNATIVGGDHSGVWFGNGPATNVTIENCQITGGIGLYLGTTANTTVKNCDIIGTNSSGVEVKSGTVNFIGGSITSDAFTKADGTINQNGSGDGEATLNINDGYQRLVDDEGSVTVTIDGTTITNATGKTIQICAGVYNSGNSSNVIETICPGDITLTLKNKVSWDDITVIQYAPEKESDDRIITVNNGKESVMQYEKDGEEILNLSGEFASNLSDVPIENVIISKDLTVGAGKTLKVTGKLIIEDKATLTVNGSISMGAEAVIENNYKIVTGPAGQIVLSKDAMYKGFDGSVFTGKIVGPEDNTLRGSLVGKTVGGQPGITVKGGSLIINGEIVTQDGTYSGVEVSGNGITITGTVAEDVTVTITENTTVNTTGLVINGEVINYGTFNIKGTTSGDVTNEGTVNLTINDGNNYGNLVINGGDIGATDSDTDYTVTTVVASGYRVMVGAESLQYDGTDYGGQSGVNLKIIAASKNGVSVQTADIKVSNIIVFEEIIYKDPTEAKNNTSIYGECRDAGEYYLYVEASINIPGILSTNYKGVIGFSIAPMSLDGKVTIVGTDRNGDIPAQMYDDGNKVELTYGDDYRVYATINNVRIELREGIDFTVGYENNRNVTTAGSLAKIIVTGAGNYKFTVEKEFAIAQEIETLDVTNSVDKYYVGEIVDPSTLTITKVYQDDSRVTLTADKVTELIRNGNLTITKIIEASTTAIVISLKENNTSVEISVPTTVIKIEEVTISDLDPTDKKYQRNYLVKESLKTNNMVITVKYENETKLVLSDSTGNGFAITSTPYNAAGTTGFDKVVEFDKLVFMNEVGDVTVNATYHGTGVPFTVYVDGYAIIYKLKNETLATQAGQAGDNAAIYNWQWDSKLGENESFIIWQVEETSAVYIPGTMIGYGENTVMWGDDKTLNLVAYILDTTEYGEILYDDENITVKSDEDVIENEEKVEFGTEITIEYGEVPEGYTLTITVNDQPIVAGEDGTYTYTVASDMVVIKAVVEAEPVTEYSEDIIVSVHYDQNKRVVVTLTAVDGKVIPAGTITVSGNYVYEFIDPIDGTTSLMTGDYKVTRDIAEGENFVVLNPADDEDAAFVIGMISITATFESEDPAITEESNTMSFKYVAPATEL